MAETTQDQQGKSSAPKKTAKSEAASVTREEFNALKKHVHHLTGRLEAHGIRLMKPEPAPTPLPAPGTPAAGPAQGGRSSAHQLAVHQQGGTGVIDGLTTEPKTAAGKAAKKAATKTAATK
jgi:hypothetical protein